MKLALPMQPGALDQHDSLPCQRSLPVTAWARVVPCTGGGCCCTLGTAIPESFAMLAGIRSFFNASRSLLILFAVRESRSIFLGPALRTWAQLLKQDRRAGEDPRPMPR